VIRLLEGLPENVVGVEASGKVTDEDYENVLVPAVRQRIEETGKVRFLYVLGEDFDGWTLGAMWEDAKLGGSEVKAWEKVALVTDKDWLEPMVKAFAWMIPGEVRVFELSARADAAAWVAS
jgi:SpoIIAA-like